MASLAQRLPVRSVPEELRVSSVRYDVIHNRCRSCNTLLQALLTEWMELPLTFSAEVRKRSRMGSPDLLSSSTALCCSSGNVSGKTVALLFLFSSSSMRKQSMRISSGWMGTSDSVSCSRRFSGREISGAFRPSLLPCPVSTRDECRRYRTDRQRPLRSPDRIDCLCSRRTPCAHPDLTGVSYKPNRKSWHHRCKPGREVGGRENPSS